MEGLQKWEEKSPNLAMYARRYRYRYRMVTTTFCLSGTGTGKSGTGTTVPYFLFYFYLFILYFCNFGTVVPIYRYTLFEFPPSRIPLNAHFFSHSYSAQPDLCSWN